MMSMISPSVASGAVLGSQRPRILHVPEFVSSTGGEAVELAALAGLELDPWQMFVLDSGLGERHDGRWAAFEVGAEVPRQNGKGGILEARELAGLFLLGERLIIHSAHEFATASEALERMDAILGGCPELSKRVRTIKRSHGEEGVYLKNGARLRYKTRTKGGGRGFSADCVILDEAMVLAEAFMGALFFTLSARPNPQVWYTGSAVDRMVMDHGVVFARLRERAVKGEDPSLAYFGWSAPYDAPGDVPEGTLTDCDVWAQANPALGIRIDPEHVAKEQRSMDPRTFAVERLGVGDWPDTTGAAEQVIADADWDALEDRTSSRAGPVVFVFDVTPDRRKAAIAVAGHREDGLRHVEIVEHRSGVDWLIDRLVELDERHQPEEVICAARSPAASFVAKLTERGVTVTELDEAEHAKACGDLVDGVAARSFRHLGTPEIRAALRGAVQRVRDDGAWTWSRKTSSVDISPLVAATLALRRAELMHATEPLLAWR
jgi:hypothetical protein